jgi:hypothetical protein
MTDDGSERCDQIPNGSDVGRFVHDMYQQLKGFDQKSKGKCGKEALSDQTPQDRDSDPSESVTNRLRVARLCIETTL